MVPALMKTSELKGIDRYHAEKDESRRRTVTQKDRPIRGKAADLKAIQLCDPFEDEHKY